MQSHRGGRCYKQQEEHFFPFLFLSDLPSALYMLLLGLRCFFGVCLLVACG